MGRVWFSSANSSPSTSSTIPPAAVNGYGPKTLDRKSMISGCRANEPSTMSPVDGGSSAVVPAIQSLALPGLPSGGPATVQPSNVFPSSSNDVVPSPVDTTTSSTTTPWKEN